MEQLTEVSEITISYRPTKTHKPQISNTHSAYIEIQKFFPVDQIHIHEMLVVMYLNRGKKVIGVYKHSTGGITGTIADIRLILGTALKAGACYIIIAHNHPSGNIKPSRNDEALTVKLMEAGRVMDIRLDDHLIISPSEGEYFSFVEHGLL